MKQEILNTFLEYVKFDTQSDPYSDTKPSSTKQFALLDLLNEQLEQTGLEVTYDRDNGYVYGLLKGNIDTFKIGFLAHVDTSPEASGKDIKPKIWENYGGENLKLDDDTILDTNIFPDLKKYIGNTIITSDGSNLLGADDKAGITEIMHGLKYIINNNIDHGDIYVAFTTDEEVGKGVVNFDTNVFCPDFAYTFDGGELGELQYENFNAASCVLDIKGVNVHPGNAKDKMINSQELAIKFHNKIPAKEKPEFTENYEGFYLLTSMNTAVDESHISYIIRDHDKKKFSERKDLLQKLFDEIILPVAPHSKIEIKDQYYNMLEKIEDKMFIVDIAKKAMEESDVKPLLVPIRGGTDGANLSFMGIPCPNIFAGGHNFHGRFEFIPLESMEKAVQTLVKIVELSTTEFKK